MEYLLLFLFFLPLLFIFLFSIGQLHLTWLYLKAKVKKTPEAKDIPFNKFPMVTIQLPVYNELYVAERLLENISKIDYPTDNLEIQVLDDSTDETAKILIDKVQELRKSGIDIHYIHRDNREDFKAGALNYGLQLAKGELIAIFDADFLPGKDFLLKTVHYFDNPEIGVVQARWGHLNKNFSLLTRLQAFGLDAHFTIEQSGRSHAGSFINFNGTGGIWRKSCIIDSGGWSADTLTEDLDLSYRAQMKGWKFKFLEDVVAPAELPIIMPAIKSQQFRWNKGAAETARKNLLKVLKSNMSLISKTHAVFHLLNSSVFLCLLLAAVISIPLLLVKGIDPVFNLAFRLGSVFVLGFFSISVFYFVAAKSTMNKNSSLYFIKIFPLFLTVSMGLALHNAYAVAEGLFGFKTPFIRTPKFNVTEKKSSLKKNIYVKQGVSYITLIEGILSLYFIFGVIAGILKGDYAFLIFHGMLALGFAIVFYYSIKPLKYG